MYSTKRSDIYIYIYICIYNSKTSFSFSLTETGSTETQGTQDVAELGNNLLTTVNKIKQ